MDIPAIFDDFVSGACANNFQIKHRKAQLNIIIKTALVAAAIGIVAKVAGLTTPVIFAVVGGVAAFAYLTSPKEHLFTSFLDAGYTVIDRR